MMSNEQDSPNSETKLDALSREELSATPLHQGKWTPEEEEYVECLIQEFKSGLLPLAEGTSLRIFLSKMLNCDPMRVSKKFVGSNYNGKQLYVRRANTMQPDEVMQRRKKLRELEQKFLKRVLPLANIELSDQGNNNTENSVSIAGGTSSGDNESSKPGVQDGSLMSMDDAAAPFPSSGHANSKAAAAGRALLEGVDSSGSKSAIAADELGNLAHASSLELVAELQRRAGGEKGSDNKSFPTGSSSSLEIAAELQQRASTENTLKRAFGGNSSNSLLDPALEVALQSLESRNKQQSAQSTLSLSGVLGGRQNSIDSVSNHALLTQARRSFGSMLDTADLSAAAASNKPEGGRNWLPGTLSSRSSAESLSGLIAQLSDTSKSSRPSSLTNRGAGVSNSNLENLLLSMNKKAGGLEMSRDNASFAKNKDSVALTNMMNSDSFFNPGGIQNQTFKKQHSIPNLSGPMADFLMQQRLKSQENEETSNGSFSASKTAALLGLRNDSVNNLSMEEMGELLKKKRRLDQGIPNNSAMDQMRELLEKKRRVDQESSGNLSMDQMRELLLKQGSADHQQLQNSTAMNQTSLTQMQELLAKKRGLDQDISGSLSGNLSGGNLSAGNLLSGSISIDQMRELLSKQRSSSQQQLNQFFNNDFS